jgi:hypothetical protein
MEAARLLGILEVLVLADWDGGRALDPGSRSHPESKQRAFASATKQKAAIRRATDGRSICVIDGRSGIVKPSSVTLNFMLVEGMFHNS